MHIRVIPVKICVVSCTRRLRRRRKWKFLARTHRCTGIRVGFYDQTKGFGNRILFTTADTVFKTLKTICFLNIRLLDRQAFPQSCTCSKDLKCLPENKRLFSKFHKFVTAFSLKDNPLLSHRGKEAHESFSEQGSKLHIQRGNAVVLRFRSRTLYNQFFQFLLVTFHK